MKTPVVVLISGRGSNMMALVEAAADRAYPARIAGVVSNRPQAPGLARAAGAGVATAIVDHTTFASRLDFDRALDQAISEFGGAFVACAGFMRVMTPWLTEKWRGRMINIHPALLPAYKGLNTHERALADGAREHGCSVHWVETEVDGGAIIAQARVPVLAGDTAETLGERVLAQELVLYPRALAQALAAIRRERS